MPLHNENIDDKINWSDFYIKYIEKSKKQGDEFLGLCPFHDDTKASFTANLKSGKYKCFACNASGNATTFLSNILGIDNKIILYMSHIKIAILQNAL